MLVFIIPDLELPYSAMRILSSLPNSPGMLAFQINSSLGNCLCTKVCSLCKLVSALSLLQQGGVTSSSCDSEKSVVIDWWVSAEPKASGWLLVDSWPLVKTLRPSFYRPILEPVKQVVGIFSKLKAIVATQIKKQIIEWMFISFKFNIL